MRGSTRGTAAITMSSVFLDTNVRRFSFMGLELGVIKLSHGILHVIGTGEFDNSSSVLVHVGVADVSGLSHVILQILPRTSRRQASNDDSVAGSPSTSTRSSEGSVSGSISSTLALESIRGPSSITSVGGTSSGASRALATREFDSKAVSIHIVSVSATNCVLRVSRIIVLDKGERRRTTILEVDEDDLAILGEEVLDILLTGIRGEVSHIEFSVKIGRAHV